MSGSSSEVEVVAAIASLKGGSAAPTVAPTTAPSRPPAAKKRTADKKQPLVKKTRPVSPSPSPSPAPPSPPAPAKALPAAPAPRAPFSRKRTSPSADSQDAREPVASSSKVVEPKRSTSTSFAPSKQVVAAAVVDEDDLFFMRKKHASNQTQPSAQEEITKVGSSSSSASSFSSDGSDSGSDSDQDEDKTTASEAGNDDDEEHTAGGGYQSFDSPTPKKRGPGRPRTRNPVSPSKGGKKKRKSKEKKQPALVLPEWTKRPSMPKPSSSKRMDEETQRPTQSPPQDRQKKKKKRIVDSDEDDDENAAAIVVMKGKRRRTPSLTPPDPIDERFLEQTLREIGTNGSEALYISSSDDNNDVTAAAAALGANMRDSELDPAVRTILEQAAQARADKLAASNVAGNVFDIEITIQVLLGSSDTVLFEHRQSARQAFTVLMEKAARARDLSTKDLVLSYKRTKLFAFSSPHSVKMPKRASIRAFTLAEWTTYEKQARTNKNVDPSPPSSPDRGRAADSPEKDTIDDDTDADEEEDMLKVNLKGPSNTSSSYMVNKRKTIVQQLLKAFCKEHAIELDRSKVSIEWDGDKLDWDTKVVDVPEFEQEDTLEVHVH